MIADLNCVRQGWMSQARPVERRGSRAPASATRGTRGLAQRRIVPTQARIGLEWATSSNFKTGDVPSVPVSGPLSQSPACQERLYQTRLCRQQLCRQQLCRQLLCQQQLCQQQPCQREPSRRLFLRRLFLTRYLAQMTQRNLQ